MCINQIKCCLSCIFPDLKGGGRTRSGSKQALAGCLASLSGMATTGIDMPLPDMPPGLDPMAALVSGDISPNTFRRISAQLRRKLEGRSSKNEEARKQLLMLDGMLTEVGIVNNKMNNITILSRI